MLILTRRCQERIMIGHNIVVQICEINDNQVKIGIAAPDNIKIIRMEIAGKEPKVAPVKESGAETKVIIKSKKRIIKE